MVRSLRQWAQSDAQRANPIWLVIFADITTNLMLFFLMMFAMTRMDMKDRDSLIEGMDKALVNREALLRREEHKRREDLTMVMLKDTLAHGRIKQYARVEVRDEGLKLTLEMPFFFQSGSAEVTEEARGALESLVGPIKEYPNEVLIEGHTDNVPVSGGRYASNWELSVARASRVIDFFVERGAEPEKLVAGGYGEYHPIAPNDTEAQRARNRRIEITLVKKRPEPALEAAGRADRLVR